MRAFFASIGRGAAWKLGADLLGRVLQYALLWAAARALAPADFGDFTFALSIGLMLAQVADFGLQLFVQRELARLAVPDAAAHPYFTDEQAAGRLVGGALVIKGFLSLVALALMTVVLLAEPVGNKAALFLLGVSAVLATGLDYLSYCFRALRRLRYEAMGLVLARLVNLVTGLAFLLLGGGVWGLAVSANLAMLVAIAFLYSRLERYVRPLFSVHGQYWRRVLAQPTAIGIGVIFSIISFRVDNLLIPPISGREALGLYNVAYKLFEPSQIIPGVLLAATFPLLSQVAHDARSLRNLLAHNLGLLLGVGALVTLAIIVFSTPVLTLLYGATFAQSAPVLRVLALACVPMYLNYLLTHALIAMDRPRLYAAFTLAGLVVNVAANLVLIPAMGIAGAAWATVGTEAVLLALCLAAVARQVRAGNIRATGDVLPGPSVEGLP